MNFKKLTIKLLLIIIFNSVASAEDTLVVHLVATDISKEVKRFPDNSNVTQYAKSNNSDLNGWNYLYRRMVSKGVDPEITRVLLSDSRMPKYETLFFSPEPAQESKNLYRKHNSELARRNAIKFYSTHRETFQRAFNTYRVPSNVVLSILQVETNCGGFVGKTPIFYRLARLATAAGRDNILSVFRTWSTVDRYKLSSRAIWLENEFLEHTISTIDVAKDMDLHPLDIRGSGAGAIGIPQFLPANVKLYGADGNNDNRVNIFNPDDAIMSVSRYLALHGWDHKKELTRKEKQEVIWHYNHSPAYVETVLNMSEMLTIPNN